MICKDQISKKLANLPIESLSKSTGYIKHETRSIPAIAFISSFFVMFSKGNNSLVDWAAKLSIYMGKVFTKGGIHSKLQPPKEQFFEELLNKVIAESMKKSCCGSKNTLLSSFNQVLVEDSMCCKLPRNLFESFPGAHSTTHKEVATARIQFRTDIKTNTVSNLEIQSFRDNDQKYSGNILSQLSKGDLVLRDMGYFVLRIFRKIMEKKAFFLSRLSYGTNVYDVAEEHQIDLNQTLKKAAKKGQHVFVKNVLVGKKEQLPARLIAIRAPQDVYQARRRKALKNTSKTSNHSKDYLDALEWTIFITNVDQNVWTPQQILKVYGFRWRIEIIFKCWKSHFNFERMFSQKKTMTLPRAKITFWLLLIWITLFFIQAFNFFFTKIYQTKNEFISILKFAKFFKEHLNSFLNHPDNNFLLDLVAHFCAYNRDKSKSNFCQQFYM